MARHKEPMHMVRPKEPQHMVRVKAHRRAQREYYVRGVKGDRATGGVLMASSREDARDEFREKHPGYEIVQVNERK